MPIENTEAKLCVTYHGTYGELPDPVSFDAPDDQIRSWVTEAVRSGGMPGITADPNASFEDFVIERQKAVETRPYNRLELRPKTPFGR